MVTSLLFSSFICLLTIFGADYLVFLFFQAEDGIRDLVRSRGLGDVYKRQVIFILASLKPKNSPIPAGKIEFT